MNKVLEDITNEENIGNFPKHVWLEFVSDELKDNGRNHIEYRTYLFD